MSQDDVVALESAISELERRIQARIGRWAITIIGSTVALALGAATQWFGLIGRVDKLETWRSERAATMEQYQEFRTQLESRLTRLETRTEEILRLLQEQHRGSQ